MSGARQLGRPPVLMILGGLFTLSALGRAGAMLAQTAPYAPAPIPPEWSELDEWSAELDEREAAVEAAGIAAQIESAQAKRTANRRAPPASDPAKARRLAALYAAMPPGRAASVLSPMAPEAAAEVLGAMAPAAAGAVMAAMTEDDARAVGAALAR